MRATARKAMAIGVALVMAVSLPLGFAATASAAPSEKELSKEDQQLSAAEMGLTPQQLEFVVKTLNSALIAAGVHPDQLSQADRQQIAQMSGLSLQEVNDSLDAYKAAVGKDNPSQIPISMPIVFIFTAAALIFAPSVFASIAGTLYGGGGDASSSIDGIGQFGQ